MVPKLSQDEIDRILMSWEPTIDERIQLQLEAIRLSHSHGFDTELAWRILNLIIALEPPSKEMQETIEAMRKECG